MSSQTIARSKESSSHIRTKAPEIKPEEFQRKAIKELIERTTGQLESVMKNLDARMQAMGTETDIEAIKSHVVAYLNARSEAFQTVAMNVYNNILDQDLQRIVNTAHPRKKIPCDKQLINTCAEQFDGKKRTAFLRIAHNLFDNGIVAEDLIAALNAEGFSGEHIATQLQHNC